MRLLYYIFTGLYVVGARFAAMFNTKAKLWLAGRRNIFDKLRLAFINSTAQVVWVHCASLGEFEQGRPVIEAIKQQFPRYKILLTFFSPSGYEVQKNYTYADFVFYLPVDTKKNAATFLNIVKPALIIFVKYEFWFHYLQQAKLRGVPLILVSGIFRKQQPFFKSYGAFHRRMLQSFTHFFVQNNASYQLLKTIGITNVAVSGDTRFDRVIAIAEGFTPIANIEQFCANHPVIVAGSTWAEDEAELVHYINTHPGIRFIIAPHVLTESRLSDCLHQFKNALLYSSVAEAQLASQVNTIIIDNIGMLSRLYKYATICYVGGAFGDDGVHNVLEAAVYAKPVVFGPVYDKYAEAVELVEAGGAFTATNALELEKLLNDLLSDAEMYKQAATVAGEYVQSKKGATEKVMRYIQEKRLLTN